MTLINERWPSSYRSEVSVGEKVDPPCPSSLFRLDRTPRRWQSRVRQLWIFAIELVEFKHLRHPYAAAEANRSPCKDGVHMAFVPRYETPSLRMRECREYLALSLL
jgi:hypothetical protein